MTEGKITLKEMMGEGVTFASHPEYKKGCPLDRALIVSDGTHGLCIDHVGPAIDYWLNEAGLGAEEWDGYPAGVWIWEGTITVSGGGMFEDRDEELEGEHRPLTEAEWDDFKLDGAGPWDSDDWIETYIGPPVVTVNELESLLQETLSHVCDDDLELQIKKVLEF